MTIASRQRAQALRTEPFEHVRSRRIESLNIEVQEYRHRATGARHFHLAADDSNNAFMVAFPTMPQDSTGVAHILEHTALCGSERYPVRDPFFMMIRRSLNSFMNAFTSSDATAYPFASPNRKDFDNLLAVYLDAVFFPRLAELDFAQEGHRLDFAKPGDIASPLVYKGVVYNEMKGAMSSPTARLWQSLQTQLFPTTTYHYNSGGEPLAIPDLTHEQLKAFHASHYHPSNAIFVTYGDIPAEEIQARIEELALSRFTARPPHPGIPDERRYDAPRAVQEPYAVEEGEELKDRSYVVMGWLLGRTSDLTEYMHMHLLTGVLLDNSASPLRHALETSSLGTAPAPVCGLDDSTREASFVCGLEGSNPESAEAVEELILGVLRDVAENGVPQKLVDAVLHQMELSQREMGSGDFPYGLQLAGRVLPVALHGGDPIAFLDIEPVLERLRQDVTDPGFIRGLVRRYLLDNPHRVRLTLVPDPELRKREQAAEAERLAALRAGMTEEQLKAVAAQVEALDERQRQTDDPDILPKVGLADIQPDIKVVTGEERPVGGMPSTWYAQGTNGLVHEQVIIALPELTEEELELLPFLWSYLTEVGSGDEDYRDTQATQALTGSLRAYSSVRAAVEDIHRLRGYFVVAGKGLYRNHAALAGLIRRTLERARFDELDHLRDLVAQSRAAMEASVTDHGHVLAMLAAASSLAPAGYLEHAWEGLLGLTRLQALDDAIEDRSSLEQFAARLAQLRDRLVSAPRSLLVVAEGTRFDELRAALETTWQNAPPAQPQTPFHLEVEPRPVREAWATNTQVNFCAKAYPAVPADHPDAAALMVLGGYLHNGYLHRAIREQGGAYGSGARYDADSASFRFYSYRDPRLADTLADFDRSVEWVDKSVEDRQLEEAILGVIRAMDQPRTPAGEAIQAHFLALHGRTPEFRRRLRARVLTVGLDELRRVARTYLDPARASIAVLSDARTLDTLPDLGLERKAV